MTKPRCLTAVALLAAASALAVAPVAARAQTVNPYMPMTTKPPGPANPKPFDPGQQIPQAQNGVIRPPPIGSRMPVIHPTTPSRMPVIPPPGTAANNPNLVPK